MFGSSGGTIYGDVNKNTIEESTKIAPISAYGLSKLCQQNYIQFYSRRYGFKAVIARISNPYGRVLTHGSKQLQGFISTSIDKIINNEKIIIWGDGKVIRDYIYIDDLVSGITALAQNTIKNDIYNLGSGVGCSINEVLAIYKSMKINCEVEYTQCRQIDLPKNVLNINKIKNKAKWHPSKTLSSGIAKILKLKSQK